MVDAQNHINTACPKTATKIGIIDPAVTKLEGDLIIENYPDLGEINLSGHALTGLTIINCPKLEKINVSNNHEVADPDKKTLKKIDLERIGAVNVLKSLSCGDSSITEISFANLKKLEFFNCPDTPTLDRFRHLDKANKLQRINVTDSAPIVFMHEVKYNYLSESVEEIKKSLGLSPDKNLPTVEYMDPATGRKQRKIDTGKLRTDLEGKINSQVPQLKTEKENAEKERDEAKNALTNLLTEIVNGAGLGLTGNDITKDKIIAKVKEIKQQAVQAVNSFLGEINNLGLGLTGNDITKDKVLEKIRELINKKPVCTHTDYDAIKAERDRLKIENENKENKQTIAKEVLVQNAEKRFSNWGIADSKYKEQFNSASANEVEELRNQLIDKRFSELGKEKKTALALNITLSVLTIGSLLVLGWLLMREASLKVESEQDKKEKK